MNIQIPLANSNLSTPLANKLQSLKLNDNSINDEIVDILLSNEVWVLIVGLYAKEHTNMTGTEIKRKFNEQGFTRK